MLSHFIICANTIYQVSVYRTIGPLVPFVIYWMHKLKGHKIFALTLNIDLRMAMMMKITDDPRKGEFCHLTSCWQENPDCGYLQRNEYNIEKTE